MTLFRIPIPFNRHRFFKAGRVGFQFGISLISHHVVVDMSLRAFVRLRRAHAQRSRRTGRLASRRGISFTFIIHFDQCIVQAFCRIFINTPEAIFCILPFK
ncbi:hypothetical protein Bcep1808_6114 [Burkholderia vietnamiensis G4]|uniref:Uncharacterized protein n=1 Tax=Burkholderia vietnamiensis (strain G4 / LMG 22486) TaxID=269482 RepID=A4JRX9_BURVG|nr:hypothetical protein Bcep1808_6114 [Burkholderia vietnamiensis G4]